jgi:hypothetical protein
VVIMIGTNDVHRRRDLSPGGRVETILSGVVGCARARLPDSHLLLMGLPPIPNSEFDYSWPSELLPVCVPSSLPRTKAVPAWGRSEAGACSGVFILERLFWGVHF